MCLLLLVSVSASVLLLLLFKCLAVTLSALDCYQTVRLGLVGGMCVCVCMCVCLCVCVRGGGDRKSVVEGKGVDRGGLRIIE